MWYGRINLALHRYEIYFCNDPINHAFTPSDVPISHIEFPFICLFNKAISPEDLEPNTFTKSQQFHCQKKNQHWKRRRNFPSDNPFHLSRDKSKHDYTSRHSICCIWIRIQITYILTLVMSFCCWCGGELLIFYGVFRWCKGKKDNKRFIGHLRKWGNFCERKESAPYDSRDHSRTNESLLRGMKVEPVCQIEELLRNCWILSLRMTY